MPASNHKELSSPGPIHSFTQLPLEVTFTGHRPAILLLFDTAILCLTSISCSLFYTEHQIQVASLRRPKYAARRAVSVAAWYLIISALDHWPGTSIKPNETEQLDMLLYTDSNQQLLNLALLSCPSVPPGLNPSHSQ